MEQSQLHGQFAKQSVVKGVGDDELMSRVHNITGKSLRHVHVTSDIVSQHC